MLAPISWLKDFTEIDCSIKEFIDKMTMSGSKVEGYETLGEDIQNVVVGKIEKITNHPDADKLVVTQVNVGEETIQIVTGADNIREGDYIPVALNGSLLPGGVKIKKGKLRGVESNGMMCSIQELGFEPSDYPEAPEHGIYILQKEYPLGTDIKPIFGLDDTVVEFEITSNRSDCYSILGLGREAAATFGKPFRYPSISLQEKGDGAAEKMIKVSIKNEELCPRYAARIVKNVTIEPSPKWLRQRLLACGIRPINNIVDITNYIMLEYGQPMHAFDYDQLAKGEIIVRNAANGEKFTTLDEVERTLDSSMLVIADGEKALAVAGVMGGQESKVTEETKTILFESANFNGTNIRLTAKKLGLRTDASSKYEKGLDPENVIPAVNRALQLIEEIGAGEVVPGTVDAYPNQVKEKKIDYDPQSMNQLLGTDLEEKMMVTILKTLECKVDPVNKTVIPPSFRPDLECEADLAEEVARIYGYDEIPTTLAIGTPTVGRKSKKQKIEDITRTVMEAYGLSEAMTYSFESPKVFDALEIPEDSDLRKAITISNPLGEDFSIMRTTAIHGLLQSISTNFNRRNEGAALYEMGTVYLPEELPLTELPTEKEKLTIGMYGKGIDFFTTKGVLEGLFERLDFLEEIEYAPANDQSWIHPGRQAAIQCENQKIGYLGELHPAVAENYDIETRVYIAEVDMGQIVALTQQDKEYISLPKYPAMVRDIAMLVKEDVLVGEIHKVIRRFGGKSFESCKLFDVYQGEQIEEGYKSVAYTLTFRSKDKTLKEKEITKAVDKILKALERELGAKLRQ